MPGIDPTVLAELQLEQALNRVLKDLRTDLIYSPHYSVILRESGSELSDLLTRRLRSGEYEPSLPISLEVPKRSALTRPGAILRPLDRLIYQAVVDHLAPLAEEQLDRERVFSTALLDPDPEHEMFLDHTSAWNKRQNRIEELCNDDRYSHALKLDVANYYERVYHHVMINSLHSAGCAAGAVNFLETLLSAWAERVSYGIPQGLKPSDFLGTFYLVGLDSEFSVEGIPSVRYVDDIYAFFPSAHEGRQALVKVCKVLRGQGLNLSEAKSFLMASASLLKEETALDHLFSAALQEVGSQGQVVEYYGIQIAWEEDDDVDPEELEIQAVKRLFLEVDEGVLADRADKLCLPILAAAKSDIGVDWCLVGIKDRPHMAKLYCSYLARVGRGDAGIVERLQEVITTDPRPYDWQLLWPIAALLYAAEELETDTIRELTRLLRDFSVHAGVRALCAIALAKFGVSAQRRVFKTHYSDEPSDYVRTAMVYGAHYLPARERSTSLAAWAGHSIENSLLARAIRNGALG